MAERSSGIEMKRDERMPSFKGGLWRHAKQDETRCHKVELLPSCVANGSSQIPSSRWTPKRGAFESYSLVQQRRQRQNEAVGRESLRRGANLRLVVSKPIVTKLTRLIIETYQLCNPSFTYFGSSSKKRILTHPPVGVSNHGLDNCHSDLILAVNSVLVHPSSNQKYIVNELLGQGTFGQVVKCWTDELDCFVAVKVIKNQPAYYQQALVEISILNMLNAKFDPGDKHHIVRISDHFYFQGHLCIVFELLAENLFELLKTNQYRGISLHLLQLFTKQIIDALVVLREASVIHCDLKPENILLTSLQLGDIKLIDFGSACMETRPVYSYIQSRFYRSPEVVLGHPYTIAIDMWSLGCIAAELFLGIPLFPGESEYDLLKRMIEILGVQPPDHMLRSSKSMSRYFKQTSAAPPAEDEQLGDVKSTYQFLTEKEYEMREKKKPLLGKHHHKYSKLEDIILNYPLRSKSSHDDMVKEHCSRLAFLDFLRGLIQFDPGRRWTPQQAALHPFVTNQPYTGPFKPLPESLPRVPVYQEMVIKHNPVTGHWLGAGLSPKAILQQGFQYYSPQGRAPHSFASSYDSYSSFGSCEDIGLGSSYGSYGGEATAIFQNCSTPQVGAFWGQMQGASALGLSPDMQPRMSSMPPNGLPTRSAALGVSPSAKSFKAMPLGGSPSQFTHPGQVFSPHSPCQVSPCWEGPSSPARGGFPNSPGKFLAVGQHHKRRGQGASILSSTHEGAYLHRHVPQLINPVNIGEISSSFLDGTGRGSGVGSPSSYSGNGLPLILHRRLQNGRVSGNAGTFAGLKVRDLHAPETLGALSASQEALPDGIDDILPPPDPNEWDPNYSGEDFLQDDITITDLKARGPAGVMGSGGARLGPGPGSMPFVGQGNFFVPEAVVQQDGSAYQRQDAISYSPTTPRSGAVQGHCFSASFNENQYPKGFQYNFQQDHFKNNMAGYHDPFSPHQISPSRLGQPSSRSLLQRQSRQAQYQPHPQAYQSPEANSPPSTQRYLNVSGRNDQILGVFPSGQRAMLPPHPRGNARLVAEFSGHNDIKEVNECISAHSLQPFHSMPALIPGLVAEQPSSWLSLSSAQNSLEADIRVKLKR